jgi:hypothetical protein
MVLMACNANRVDEYRLTTSDPNNINVMGESADMIDGDIRALEPYFHVLANSGLWMLAFRTLRFVCLCLFFVFVFVFLLLELALC